MSAGESARAESQRAKRTAFTLRKRAAAAEQRAQSFHQGAAGESRTAQLLGPLSAYGFHLLHDRRWPGTTNANIDHLAVGPSGVFVIDTKSWSGELTIDDSGLWQGQDCQNAVLESVQTLADVVRDGLSGVGLPPSSVRPVLAFDGRDLALALTHGVWVVGAELLPRQMLTYSKCLTQSQVEVVLRALMDLFPLASDLPVAPARRQDTKPATLEPPAAAVRPIPPDALFTVSDLEDDALAAATRAPLEDWMIFLHPKQADFARRQFQGPALLRGAAGTGKTVVALHRLAYLAERRSESLLFLSFVRTLPVVLKAAYARLSPHTVERVEFASLHGWASQLLTARGQSVRLDSKGCEEAYRDAWHAVGTKSVLDKPDTWTYWSEEVRQVIRGRRLASLEEYQALSRTGRGARLGPVQRETLWRLKEDYEARLRRRGLSDWEDLLRAALRSLQAEPLEPPYDSVVVDEVQDLTRTGVELVAYAAVDGPDSLLLVGDSHQAVFAGGVSPRQAGISVQGRSSVLNVNYRNTAEILDFAAPLVADDDDVLADGELVNAQAETLRHGLQPVVAQAPNRRDLETALVSMLQRTAHSGRTSWSGMAVLCARLRDVERYRQLLVAQGIPVVALESWNGQRVEAVKVGTIKRAKGLEFLFVFLPEVDVSILPGGRSPDAEVDRERLMRARRELYVAATRARDGLWLGLRTPASRLLETAPVEPVTDDAPADAPAGSVHELALRLFGIEVQGGPLRFTQTGWESQGPLALACDACTTPLQAFRRPYMSGGKPYRYWALVCQTCRSVRAPQDLPGDLRKVLSKMATDGDT